MTEQFLILAEGGAHAAGGVPPYLVGIGTFVILLSLYGITWLASGLNQPKKNSQAADEHANR